MQFCTDKMYLVLLGIALRLETEDLVSDLLDAQLKLLLAAFPAGVIALEQPGFTGDDGRNVRGVNLQILRKFDTVDQIALREQTCATDRELCKLCLHDGALCPRLGIIQTQQNVSRSHSLNLPARRSRSRYRRRGAGRFHILVDGNHALRYDRSRQLGCRGPAADAGDQQKGEGGRDKDAGSDAEAAQISSPPAFRR